MATFPYNRYNPTTGALRTVFTTSDDTLAISDGFTGISNVPVTPDPGPVTQAQIAALETIAHAAATYVPLTQRGAANGYAALGADGKVPLPQLSLFFPGCIHIDQFAGATDDDKLIAYRTYCLDPAHVNNKPALLWGDRDLAFSRPFILFDGFRLKNMASIIGNADRGRVNPARIVLSMNDTWLQATSASSGRGADGFLFGVGWEDIVVDGGTSAVLIGTDATTVLYCGNFNGITTNILRAVMGGVGVPGAAGTTTKTNLTATKLYGWFAVANCTKEAFTLGGSDNDLFQDGGVLDSSIANGTVHLNIDYLEKTKIGPLYITCQNTWTGVQMNGPAYNSGNTSNQGGPVWFAEGFRCEGKDANTPALNPVCVFYGGTALFSKAWFAYGCKAAAASWLSGGLVVLQGTGNAYVEFDGCTFDRYVGQAETFPMVYADNGAIVEILRAKKGSKGGAWTGLPRVRTIGTSATTSKVDASCVQLTT